MNVGLLVLYSVFQKHGLDLMLTEGTGGKHAVGSLHLVGLADDYRSFTVPAELVDTIRKEVYVALGNDAAKGIKSEFDFVLEDTHFHLEFQPKT